MSGLGLRRGADLLLLVLTCGCAPWQATGTARALERGEWEAGLGLAMLAPQSLRIWQAFPAPQLWVARGIASHTEARLIYAPPISFDARLKRELGDVQGTTFAVHAGGGWMSYGGAAGVPLSGLPFGAFGAAASRRPGEPAEPGRRTATPFATFGATVPFVRHVEDRTALGVWLTGSVGVEWARDDGWVAPQVGMIVPLGQRDRWIWIPGVAAGVRR